MKTPHGPGRWLWRLVRRLWAKASLDGAPPPLAYQPQHLWSDGTFDMWANIGEPTISKRVTRSRLELFRMVNPDAKLRVLQINSRARVATEFSPNIGSQPTRPQA
jgi:hypothetical protein